jgi:GT2 family glycosyltransferase
VAVAGPFGLASADLREYEERTEGEVTAVQGYCLAARRSDLLAIGGVRESFAFYRNADIDTSLRLRTSGTEVRRAVAVGADRCRRHTHRAWEATSSEERDGLSRRNLRRVLDRFGERVADLAVP